MAVQRALAELDIAPGELREDQYAVSVLVQPEAGFMGVEGTDALVEVRLLLGDSELPAGLDFEEQYEDDEVEEEYAQPEAGSARLRELLTTVLDLLGVEAKIRIVETAEALTADITGDDLGILIGKRGQTIDALEYVANVALYPNPAARKQVRIDAEGYKKRRQAGIERIAVRKAEEVVKRGRPVQLEPMTAAERKIVHLALKEWREVVTESRGREPSRAVVISPVR
ncbi:MAG: R3H domain protein [Actinobacteria bacterium ADurb.Bin444]|nr:MAG: R3H domain protein [Actinobacteria bacterium ADurb.Bin444]